MIFSSSNNELFAITFILDIFTFDSQSAAINNFQVEIQLRIDNC